MSQELLQNALSPTVLKDFLPENNSLNTVPVKNSETYTIPLFVTTDGYVDIYQWALSKNLTKRDLSSLLSSYIRYERIERNNEGIYLNFSSIGNNKRLAKLDVLNSLFNKFLNDQAKRNQERQAKILQEKEEKRKASTYYSHINSITSLNLDQVVSLIQYFQPEYSIKGGLRPINVSPPEGSRSSVPISISITNIKKSADNEITIYLNTGQSFTIPEDSINKEN